MKKQKKFSKNIGCNFCEMFLKGKQWTNFLDVNSMSVPYPVHFRPDPAKHNSDPYQQLAGFFSDVFSAIYRHDTQMFIARRHRGEGI